MRTIFIVNPTAGTGKGVEKFITKIRTAARELSVPVEIYKTKGVGDGENFVKSVLHDLRKEKGRDCNQVRFIACGGDGTLNEVLNGMIGHENAALGVVPIGTGNDFVRNFSKREDFLDIRAQLKGSIIKSDAIKFTRRVDGVAIDRVCANMFNIGLDCNVVDLTSRLKEKPLIAGSMAYILSTLIILIKKKGANLKLVLDDKLFHQGPILLTTIANGSYCGGGVKSNPYADIQDGKIDVSVIMNAGRMRLLKLFPKYMKGTHLEDPSTEKMVKNRKGRKLVITPYGGHMRLCTDGEITDVEEVIFQIVPEAFNMIIPS